MDKKLISRIDDVYNERIKDMENKDPVGLKLSLIALVTVSVALLVVIVGNGRFTHAETTAGSPVIAVGQVWVMQTSGPWSASHDLIVTDIKDGWVRYQVVQGMGIDRSETIETFTRWYTLKSQVAVVDESSDANDAIAYD